MNVFDILFPPYCVSCQKLTQSRSDFYKYICIPCFEKIRINQKDFCHICNVQIILGKACQLCRKKTFFSGIVVASNYNNPILKEIIHHLKYRYIKALSLSLSWILMAKLKSFPWGDKNDWLLVPIPSAKKRLKLRGFNQAELLASNLSKLLGISISSAIIKRAKFCIPQMQIENIEERKKNVKGSFEINQSFSELNLLKKKKVMLIDDVMTTGATLNECAKILESHVKEIWGCVIAK